MASYPSDALAPTAAFPVVSTVKYSSTGASATVFNLSQPVSHSGEVAAFIDGVLQGTSGYSISNSGATVTFLAAPNASNHYQLLWLRHLLYLPLYNKSILIQLLSQWIAIHLQLIQTQSHLFFLRLQRQLQLLILRFL